MNDNNDPKDDSRTQLLDQILQVFGRKQEPGEPPLESLSPSERLIPNSPLTKEERNVMFWADLRFYGIKDASPDDPIYRTGYSISFLTPSQKDTLKRLRESERAAQAQDSPKLEPE